MNFKTLLLTALFILGVNAPRANALHVGAFFGPSHLSGNFPALSSQGAWYTTSGLDIAFEMLPEVEVGAFYQHNLNSYQTLIGLEANFFPALTHTFSVGVKLANANLSDGNHLAYGPSLGLNHDLIPSFFSLGIETTYFMYSVSGINDLSLLACAKLWL